MPSSNIDQDSQVHAWLLDQMDSFQALKLKLGQMDSISFEKSEVGPIFFMQSELGEERQKFEVPECVFYN